MTKKRDNNSTQKGVPLKPNWIFWIPIFISVFSLGYSIYNNDKTKNIEFKINTLSYNPQLSITRCQLTDLQIKSSPFQITNDDLRNDTIEKKVTAQFTVNFDIKLKNVGNSNAHLLFIAFTDTTTGDAYFRQLKDNKNFPLLFGDSNTDYFYYSDIQVRPNTEYSRQLETSINFLKDEIFTFHLWIVYKNDLGMLYDTYYWYRGKISDFSFGSYFNILTGELVNPKIQNLESLISLIDDNNSFYIYSKKETKKMLNYSHHAK